MSRLLAVKLGRDLRATWSRLVLMVIAIAALKMPAETTLSSICFDRVPLATRATRNASTCTTAATGSTPYAMALSFRRGVPEVQVTTSLQETRQQLHEAEKPGVTNLLDILSAMTDRPVAELETADAAGKDA